MGVDHDAVSGYGFVLGPEEKRLFLYNGDWDDEDNEYEDHNERLEKFLEKYPDLGYLEAGMYSYTGDEDHLALAIVVNNSYKRADTDYPDEHWWNYIELGSITPEAQKQLEEAADALAIDNPRFGFVAGVHTW